MDSAVLVAVITSGLAFLSAVFTGVLNFVNSNKRAREARETTLQQAEENRRLAEETQRAVADANFADKTQHIEDGLQCLLRAEIIRTNEKYMFKQYCPVYAKESLKRIYKAYHALGGNDVATHLYDEIMKLPETNVDSENDS